MHGIGACDRPGNAARQLPHVLYQIVQRYRPTPCPADIHCQSIPAVTQYFFIV